MYGSIGTVEKDCRISSANAGVPKRQTQVSAELTQSRPARAVVNSAAMNSTDREASEPLLEGCSDNSRRPHGQGGTQQDDSVVVEEKAAQSNKHVYLNDPSRNKAFKYPDNVVTTSKYTKFNFVPLFLWRTFSKTANAYFLFVACLQTIKPISNTGGMPTVLLPLSVVILADAIFAILEDQKRHKADRLANGAQCRRLDHRTGIFEDCAWRELSVGDIILVKNREVAPADLVVLSTSDSNNVIYVETKSIDGETNLKIREAISPTSDLRNGSEMARLRAEIECEQPNKQLSKFNGVFRLLDGERHSGEFMPVSVDQASGSGQGHFHGPSRASSTMTESPSRSSPRSSPSTGVLRSGRTPSRSSFSSLASSAKASFSSSLAQPPWSLSSTGPAFALQAKHMFLRGCSLRNTDWAMAAVVSTGHQCKVMMGAISKTKKPPSKLEQQMNRYLKVIMALLVFLCCLGTAGGLYYQKRSRSAWYLSNPTKSTNHTQSTNTHLAHGFQPNSPVASRSLVKHTSAPVRTLDREFQSEFLGERASLDEPGVSSGHDNANVDTEHSQNYPQTFNTARYSDQVGSEAYGQHHTQEHQDERDSDYVRSEFRQGQQKGAKGSEEATEQFFWHALVAAAEPVGSSFLVFLSFFLLTDHFIPVSLYVSMNSVKFIQGYFMSMDLDMYDERTDQPAIIRSMELNEELGQISYIFTDKTGTLTENCMRFRQCSVFGRLHGRVRDSEEASKPSKPGQRSDSDIEGASITNSHRQSSTSASRPYSTKSFASPVSLRASASDTSGKLYAADGEIHNGGREEYGGENGLSASSILPKSLQEYVSFDSEDFASLVRAEPTDPESAAARDFLLGLSLCHTIVPERVGGDEQELEERGKDIGVEEQGDEEYRQRGQEEYQQLEEEEQNGKDVTQHSQGLYKASPPKHIVENERAGVNSNNERSTTSSLGLRAASRQQLGTSEKRKGCFVSKNTPFDDIVYSASSPDELALVSFAASQGFRFLNRTPGSAEVLVHERTRKYNILDILEFSSDRKRMSVVVQEVVESEARTSESENTDQKQQENRNVLTIFCKGADTVILERLSEDSVHNTEHVLRQVQQHLADMSRSGLRTLLISAKTINADEYADWKRRMDKAKSNVSELEKRSKGEPNQIDRMQDELERDLHLLGATGIEDKLQENVAGTIRSLSAAGIKTWVLTGDREETAINISISCGLFRSDTNLHIFNRDAFALGEKGKDFDLDKCVRYLNEQADDIDRVVSVAMEDHDDQQTMLWPTTPGRNKDAGSSAKEDMEAAKYDHGIVIDGECIEKILSSARATTALLRLADMCRGVVACRVSPAQKAEIVRVVKRRFPSKSMLAIGDGANDVAMLQGADVGVGISGQEGMQAVNAADFAFAQFHFLAPLLLHHGRWNLRRMSCLVGYTFYKNIMMTLTQYWFVCGTMFSGQKFYHEVAAVQMYNVVYTCIPIIILGVFDKDIPAFAVDRFPQVYKEGSRGEVFNRRIFLKWVISGFVDSIVVFGVVLALSDSRGGMWADGAMAFSYVVVIVNLTLCLEQNAWTVWTPVTVAFSVMAWFVVGWTFSSPMLDSPTFRGVLPYVVSQPNFWLGLVLCIIGIGGTRLYARYYTRYFRSTVASTVQEWWKFVRKEIEDDIEWAYLEKRRALRQLKRARRARWWWPKEAPSLESEELRGLYEAIPEEKKLSPVRYSEEKEVQDVRRKLSGSGYAFSSDLETALIEATLCLKATEGTSGGQNKGRTRETDE